VKIVCERCGRTVPLADLRIEADGAVLTCSECGFENRLAAGPAAAANGDASAGSTPADGPPAMADDGTAERAREPLAREAPPAPDDGDQPVHPDPGDTAANGGVAPDEPRPATSVEALAETEQIKCPKCFRWQPVGENCVACGLDLTRTDLSPSQWDQIPEGKEAEWEAAERLWSAVEAHPDDRASHRAFLDYSGEHQLLEMAVRRYRSRLADEPDEAVTKEFGARAGKRLESLALALLPSDRQSSQLNRQVQRLRIVLILLAAALLIAGLILLAIALRKQAAMAPSAI
jgi:hypothetical protein